MRRTLIATCLGVAGLLAAVPARAHHSPSWESPGSLVGVSVEVEGRSVPLYPAPDGSGRVYLEAREGARYAVQVANRTHERLGVALTVDGLNAISGERAGASSWGGRSPGRMYVVDPWDSVSVRGWRTSLADIRRFTFVDERASYAARSGKANAKMGWIEVAVYRERPRPHALRRDPYEGSRERYEGEEGAADAARPAPRAEAPAMKAPPAASGGSADAYPGTGWGPRADDPAMLVDFQPQASPAERITLRYEYAPALRALGIFPAPWWARDRLREREAGDSGFARPPRW